MAQTPSIWMSFTAQENCKLGYTEFDINVMKEYFNIIWYTDLQKNPNKGKNISGALVSPSDFPFFKEQHNLMPKLKVIANHGVGYDHIDVGSFAQEGIQVSNTPHVLSACVADMAMSLLLAVARNLHQGIKRTMYSPVPEHSKNFLGVRVTGSTIGIIGLGSIGKLIAQRAKGFDMKILYHQRNRSPEDEGMGYYQQLHDMLPQCDSVVLACPLTEHTKHLISTREFSLMKNTASIVNIARGAIIDTEALVKALQSGQIRSAGLDVTDPEPLPPGHPLSKMDNVIIMPHSGSATFQTRSEMLRMCIANLKAVLIEDTPMPNLLNHNII